MAIDGTVYAYDEFNDSNGTLLEAHSPIVGGAWSKVSGTSAEIQGNELILTGKYNLGTLSPAPDNFAYCDKQIVFTQVDSSLKFIFGQQVSGVADGSGWVAVWLLHTGDIALSHWTSGVRDHHLTATIDPSSGGTHVIRIIGEGETLTAYFDGKGLRFTNIPSGDRSYRGIGFQKSFGEVHVLSVWGKNAVEEDFFLNFDTDFGPIGGPAGSGGGGGGSGGSPSSGGSNPSDVPCDPNTTLVINNGEVVAVAPVNPCQWTGLIWWKLVCGEILTVADYAVEAEVFFNTLSDPFMSVGVIARLNESTGGHYWATLWNDEIAIGKRPSAGADDILLGFKLLTLQAGRWYKIRLEVEGFTLRAYLDDVLQVTAVDLNESFPAAGCAGIRLSRSNPATDIRFDNFRVWLNVIRPSFAELPVFLESISVLKDDGMTSDFNIGLADSLNASEALTLLTPKTVHINEGIIFDDLPKQVKKIQEFMRSLDAMDPLRVRVTLNDIIKGKETQRFRMDVPISEIFTFTDEDRAIHGISETMTIGEFLISLAKESGALDLARASDTVKITRTSTATFVKPEQTYEARALKTIFTVDDAKRVN